MLGGAPAVLLAEGNLDQSLMENTLVGQNRGQLKFIEARVTKLAGT